MTDTRWGATLNEWELFDKTLALGKYLLPVVSNPHAKLSPKSALSTLGKMPSRYDRSKQVWGIGDWVNKEATEHDIRTWKRQGDYGICVRGQGCNAWDVDVEDPVLASEIHSFTCQYFEQHWPLRGRGGVSKFLMPFRLPANTGNPKKVIKCKTGMIEWLATGQQWVAAGTHPSGERYYWQWKVSSEPEIPALNHDEAEGFWSALEEKFAIEPSTTSGGVRDRQLERIKTDDKLLLALEEKEMVIRQDKEGRVHITCPFEDEHTTESTEGSTTYFPANTGGFKTSTIKCLHGHCSHRKTGEFMAKLGLGNPYEVEFPDLTKIKTPEPGGGEIRSGVQGATKKPIANALEGLIAEKPRYSQLCDYAAGDFFMPWLIKGVLPWAQVGMVYGPPGSGKTFACLDLAWSIARGEAWRGLKTKQGKVVYIASEGSAGFRMRIKAYAEKHGKDVADDPIYTVTDVPSLLKQEDMEQLVDIINEIGGVVLVVIDTLSSAAPGLKENNAEDMGKIFGLCRQMNKLTGAMFLLVHHSGKDVDKGARGSSAIPGFLDCNLSVSREGEVRALNVDKQRDGSDGAKYGFKLERVAIGTDEDGEIIESCVIEQTDVLPVISTRKKTKKQMRVLKMLEKLREESGAGAYPDRSTLVEAIRTATDDRPTNIHRCIDALIRVGEIEEIAGIVAPTLTKED